MSVKRDAKHARSEASEMRHKIKANEPKGVSDRTDSLRPSKRSLATGSCSNIKRMSFGFGSAVGDLSRAYEPPE